ncbi:hypothetical protein pb186bvf_009938 [Paramecium bursaria]
MFNEREKFLPSFMYIKQLLQFDSIKQLPKDFNCKICLDVCRLPIVYDFEDDPQIWEYCDFEIKIVTNYLSSFLQFHISYDCHYCGKNINYWNSKIHFYKCEDIVHNLKDMMANFQIIKSQESYKCEYCNYLPFNPKQYQGKIVCLFCSSRNSLLKLDELCEEQLNSYENLQIRCIQCKEILKIKQAFIHFKKCLFNRYKIRKFEIYYYVKQLRKQQKQNDKLFNVNMKDYVDDIQNIKKLNLQINQSQTEERRISRKLQYLQKLKIQQDI